MERFFAIAEKLILPAVGIVIAVFSYLLNERVAGFETEIKANNQLLAQLREERSLHWNIINKVLEYGNCEKPGDMALLIAAIKGLPGTDMQAVFTDVARSAADLCAISQGQTSIASETASGASGDGTGAASNPEQVTKQAAYAELSKRAGEDLYQLQTAQVTARPPQNLAPATGTTWGNWDFDLFYCEGSRLGQEKAETVLVMLKSDGAAGRIRVRLLPESVNQRSGYGVSGYQIRANANQREQEIAGKLKAMADTTLNPPASFKITKTTQETKWYVSAFFCPKPDGQ